MNGGKNMRRAVGMAGKMGSRQTQPADSPSGTGLITNGHQLAGLAAKTTAADDVGLPCR